MKGYKNLDTILHWSRPQHQKVLNTNGKFSIVENGGNWTAVYISECVIKNESGVDIWQMNGKFQNG